MRLSGLGSDLTPEQQANIAAYALSHTPAENAAALAQYGLTPQDLATSLNNVTGSSYTAAGLVQAAFDSGVPIEQVLAVPGAAIIMMQNRITPTAVSPEPITPDIYTALPLLIGPTTSSPATTQPAPYTPTASTGGVLPSISSLLPSAPSGQSDSSITIGSTPVSKNFIIGAALVGLFLLRR